MEHDSRTPQRGDRNTVLWTPWGPVPDASSQRDGKVTRLRPREQAVRHKRVGFDMRPREVLPTRQ
jgi:hypothetical protein